MKPDGIVSTWTSAGKLNGARSHFSVTRIGDYVFMAGGLDQSALDGPPNLDEVARGHILSDGTLGEWTLMPKLPVALATHASMFYGGYLYVGGGIDSAVQEKRFWRAGGHVHQLPILGDHVYSVSGAIDFNLLSTNHVEVGTFQ